MADELLDLLASTVAPFGLELVDLELRPGVIRVVVDGPEGAGLDAISEATRAVSHVLDAHDPVPGQRYTLEVSSPGVERPLRTPAHFARAVGETVSVRTAAGGPGTRRLTGKLLSADDHGFVLGSHDGPDGGERHFSYDEIERARTVFEWGTSQPAASSRRRPPAKRGSDRKKVTAS